MSDVKVEGFKASALLSELNSVLSSYTEEERKKEIKKNNGIFELRVTNAEKQEAIWTIDFKKTGTVYKGAATPKADVTIILSDDILLDLAEGKLTGQKAFMTGKLKTKGNLMLSQKLDGILKGAKAKAKL